MRSLTNTAFVVAVLVALAAYTTIEIERRQSEDPTAIETRSNDPDTYMVNATIKQFDRDGQVKHIISADRFTHYPVSDVTTLVAPTVDLFGVSETPWIIASREGRILPPDQRGETLELKEDVVAERVDKSGVVTSIRSATMSIRPGINYAETDTIVQIKDARGETTAAGMQAWLESGKFLFYGNEQQRVHSTLLPGT